MAMSINEQQTNNRRRNARPNTGAVIPPVSREATARKLDILDTEDEMPEYQPQVSTTVRPDREAEAKRQEQLQLVEKLIEKRSEFVERLDIGAAKIEEARAQGKDVSSWEDYWISLLHQYEQVCNKLREMQAEEF